MKISITNKFLNFILLDSLEYSKEEVDEMNREEKLDNFVGAGYFENEDEVGGILDVKTEGFVDFEAVLTVTGHPVSLDEYFKIVKPSKKLI